MLGDACHFFPRATRSIGERTIMSASMSCPEIARLMTLLSNTPLEYVDGTIDRLRHSSQRLQPYRNVQ